MRLPRGGDGNLAGREARDRHVRDRDDDRTDGLVRAESRAARVWAPAVVGIDRCSGVVATPRPLTPTLSPQAGRGSGAQSVRGIRRFPNGAPPAPRMRGEGVGLSRYAASDDSRTVRLPLPARGEREWDSVGARHPTIPEPCASLSPHAGRGSGAQSVRGIRRFLNRAPPSRRKRGEGVGLSRCAASDDLPNRAPPSPRKREEGVGRSRCAASDDSRTVRLPLPASWEREWGSVGTRHPTIPEPCASLSPQAGRGSGLSRCAASDDSRTVRLPLPASWGGRAVAASTIRRSPRKLGRVVGAASDDSRTVRLHLPASGEREVSGGSSRMRAALRLDGSRRQTVRLPLPASWEREWGSVGAWHPTIPELSASLSPLAGRGLG